MVNVAGAMATPSTGTNYDNRISPLTPAGGLFLPQGGASSPAIGSVAGQACSGK